MMDILPLDADLLHRMRRQQRPHCRYLRQGLGFGAQRDGLGAISVMECVQHQHPHHRHLVHASVLLLRIVWILFLHRMRCQQRPHRRYLRQGLGLKVEG